MNAFQIVRAFGLLTILSGCYIERDVDTTPPLQTNVKRITLSEHISFSAQHWILTHQEAKRLREDIHRLSGAGPIYARLVVRQLHAKFDDSMTDPRVASVVKLLKRHGVEQHRIEVIEEGDNNPPIRPKPRTACGSELIDTRYFFLNVLALMPK